MTSSVCPEIITDRTSELPVLKFNKEFLAPIIAGNKVSTTRLKKYSFKRDNVVRAVFIGESMSLKLVIADIESKKFKELNRHDAWLEGYNNLDDFKDVLKKIYPKIKPQTRVCIYRFATVGE